MITRSASTLKSIALNNKEDKHANICLKQPESKVIFKPEKKHLKIIMPFWIPFISSFTNIYNPQKTTSLQNKSTQPKQTTNIQTNFTHERELFAFLAKKGSVDFNIKDSKGWSPIHRAIVTGHVEIMKLLIYKSKGADLNTSSCSEHTPLTCAILKENLEIVEELIKSGADVDKDYGWTPLTMAIHKGNQEITILLTRNAANPNFFDSKNWTPISRAIEEENLEITKLLVDNGADVNMADGSSWTPVNYAIFKGKKEIVITLLENGAIGNCIMKGVFHL